jgi:hypothetical protein
MTRPMKNVTAISPRKVTAIVRKKLTMAQTSVRARRPFRRTPVWTSVAVTPGGR